MANGQAASAHPGCASAARPNASTGGLAARKTAPPIAATSTSAASLTIRLFMIALVTLLRPPLPGRVAAAAQRLGSRTSRPHEARGRLPPAGLLLGRIDRHRRHEAVAVRHLHLRQALRVHHVGLADDAVAIEKERN